MNKNQFLILLFIFTFLKTIYSISPIPNLKYDTPTSTLSLWGDDLGTSTTDIVNSNGNSLTWTMVTPSKLFTAPLSSIGRQTDFEIQWISINKTFYLSTNSYTPILYQLNTTFSPTYTKLVVIGIRLTYNVSDVKITYNNQICVPSSASYSQIQCEFGGIIPSTKYIDLIVTISGSLKTKWTIQSVNPAVCKNNCSNQGVCPDGLSVCQCNPDRKGDDCSIGIHTISSVEPCKIDGGLVTIFGNFYNNHTDPLVIIGDDPCEISSINVTTVVCTAKPGNGVKNINITQNGFTQIAYKSFQYIVPIFKCINDCNLNGVCNNTIGECNCNKQWSGPDCSIEIKEQDSSSKSNTTTNVHSSAAIELHNEQTNYQILINQLVERNPHGDIIISHKLKDNWVLNKTFNDGISINESKQSTISRFIQSIPNQNSTISYIIEEVNIIKDYKFGGVSFTVNPGSIKISIEINNYEYESPLNTLQLQMETGSKYFPNENENCNVNVSSSTFKFNTTTGSNDFFSYILIKKDSKFLIGRFVNRVISENRSTYMDNEIISQNDSSLIYAVNLPHCSNCIIDPDFSVLVSPKDNNLNCNVPEKKPMATTTLVLSIVIPVIGTSILVSIFLIIKKKRAEAKIERIFAKINLQQQLQNEISNKLSNI